MQALEQLEAALVVQPLGNKQLQVGLAAILGSSVIQSNYILS